MPFVTVNAETVAVAGTAVVGRIGNKGVAAGAPLTPSPILFILSPAIRYPRRQFNLRRTSMQKLSALALGVLFALAAAGAHAGAAPGDSNPNAMSKSGAKIAPPARPEASDQQQDDKSTADKAQPAK